MSPPATPIIMKRIVQTGANSQFGGLKMGLTNVGYQVSMLFCVTVPDKYPITKHVITTKTIRIILCMLIRFLTNIGNDIK